MADRFGVGSPEWAGAQCDLGNLMFQARQTDRALECFRAAASMTPRDDAGRKDRITYRLNVGSALQQSGRYDEAETELREGLAERLDFYGRRHAGYAFGLEQLAELLLVKGDLAAARAAVEETVSILAEDNHPRLPAALVTRAAVLAAQGEAELLEHLPQLPEEDVVVVGQEAIHRTTTADVHAPAVLQATAAALEKRLGLEHPATLNALAQLVNLGRVTGDHAGRLRAGKRILAAHDRRGDAEAGLRTALGLAMIHGEAGDQDAALRTYASAYERAGRLGRDDLFAQVLRNWGLALSEAGRPGDAAPRLTEAVQYARGGSDPSLLARSLIALGIFLQHQERPAEARAALEEGLALADPVDPDTMSGRGHLSAVLDGRTCGCGDIGGAITEAFREFLLARVPAELIEDLDVTLADGGFQVSVNLRREPTQAEGERLQEVFTTAEAEFRQRMSAGEAR